MLERCVPEVRVPDEIRMANEADAEAIAAIYAPTVENTAISFETTAPDRDEFARRLCHTLETLPWLVFEAEDGVAGYAYASAFRAREAYRWSCEVSLYVASDAHRGGVGRRLYLALLELLTRQGYRRAFAGITLPNPASVGLHEALGFETVGVYRAAGFKFDAWHDVGWWQRALLLSDAPPEPTLDLADAVAALDFCAY